MQKNQHHPNPESEPTCVAEPRVNILAADYEVDNKNPVDRDKKDFKLQLGTPLNGRIKLLSPAPLSFGLLFDFMIMS